MVYFVRKSAIFQNNKKAEYPTKHYHFDTLADHSSKFTKQKTIGVEEEK